MVVTGVLPALLFGGRAAASTDLPGAEPGGAVQAVVELSGMQSITAPGVTVLTELPAVHAEIVRGSSAALAALAGQPGVVAVTPDRLMEPTSLAAKPGPVNDAQPGQNGKGNSKGNGKGNSEPAPAVLADGVFGGQAYPSAGKTPAGTGVTVAVIDTGVSDTPALSRGAGHLVDAVDTSGLVPGGDGHVHTSGTFSDGYGHGTFMASLIAGGAVAGSGGYTLGVAPGATVDVVRVAGSDGRASLASVLAGLNWVAAHHGSVQVANLSFGVAPVNGYHRDPLNFAVELTRLSGVAMVVTAGNTPGQVTDPGFDPLVLTVGAADTTGAAPSVAAFSGSAVVAGVTKPNLVAPGVHVLGQLPPTSVLAANFPASAQPGGLWRGSGSSEATALTSGAAAVFLAAHHGSSVSQVYRSLVGSALPLGAAAAGAGLLQIPTSVAADDSAGKKATSLKPSAKTQLTAGKSTQVMNTRAAKNTGGKKGSGSGSASGSGVSWDGVSWDGVSWDGVSWDGVSWDGVSWDGVSWDGVSWDGVSWDGVSWDGVSWDGVSWDGVSWDGVSWDGVSWDGVSWDGVSWDGVSWDGLSWD